MTKAVTAGIAFASVGLSAVIAVLCEFNRKAWGICIAILGVSLFVCGIVNYAHELRMGNDDTIIPAQPIVHVVVGIAAFGCLVGGTYLIRDKSKSIT